MSTALQDGARRVSGAPAILAGLWALTVIVSLPLTFTMRGAFARHLGNSLAAETAADSVNYDWMQEFSGQATVYLARERRHFWASAPGRWVLAASAGDVLVVAVMASRGILMDAVPAPVIAGLLVLVACWAVVLDVFKVRVFGRFGVH